MSLTVIVNSRTVVHKGSSGKAPSVPDVCKTPAPPGPPVPIPYPNIANSSDTSDGSKSVKMDCSMIALKNAKFSTSVGDEAGTLKGIVSSTNKGVAKFANYSFTVKVEGKNVARLGDPMTSNGNAPNTTTVAELQKTTGIPNIDMTDEQVKIICEAFCECQSEYDNGNIEGRGCCSKCLEDKLSEQNRPDIMSEQSAIMSSLGGQVMTPNIVQGAAEMLGTSTLAKLAGYTAGMAPGAAVPTWLARKFMNALKPFTSGNAWMRIPDIITTNPLTAGREVLDAKFTYQRDAQGNITKKDTFRGNQKPDYRRLNDGKEPIEISEETCQCK